MDNAFWRYLRPSYRRGRDRDEWLQERIYGRRNGSTPAWGTHPAVLEGARIEAIQVSRDAVHVTIDLGDTNRGWGARPQMDTWVREERAFYIDLSNEPTDDLIQHDWFVLGTFSVKRFAAEVDRLRADEDRPNLTDLERSQLREDREKVEQELRTRTVADMGVVANVRKIAGLRRNDAPTFEVTINVGTLGVRLAMVATSEVPVEDLEKRLSSLSQGARVYFRGQPTSWGRSTEYLGLEELSLSSGEIETSP